MLSRPPATKGVGTYRKGPARRFYDDPERHPQCLGCSVCIHRSVCGGLHVDSGAFDCLGYCCGQPASCDSVCVNNVETFVARVREVGGFAFDDIPPTQVVARPELPQLVPLVYHGSSRHRGFGAPAVAVSLYTLLDRGSGKLKYPTREALCRAFRISPNAALVITGTAADAPLERWWALGSARMKILDHLSFIGVAAITTPNYSLFSNTPRWDDLHSMKRIAIAWEEMVAAGLPTGLHLNARTVFDWRRWRDFVGERPEVNLLAFEFATGASDPQRAEWYSDQLCRLADEIRRPLTILVRGGTAVVPLLEQHYAAVSVVDATPFIKAVKRQRARRRASGGIEWHSMAEEDSSVPVADLLDHNYLEVAEQRLSSGTGNPDRD